MSLVLGVIFPLIVLGVELTCRLCTNAFFDPIPTWWHVLMIAYVAYANAWAWTVLRNPGFKPGQREGLIIGAAIGISFIYTLRFLPLAPLGFFFCICWGMGLLVFGPMLSCIVAGKLANRLSYDDPKAKTNPNPAVQRCILPGFVIGVSCIFLAEMPYTVTRQGVLQALSTNATEARNGINLLRNFGSQHELLRLCYSDKLQMADFLQVAFARRAEINQEKARNVFYRVTGMPFNKEKYPKELLGSIDTVWDWGWDSDRGGESVGGRIDQLSLKTSELDVVCDPNSASADMQWTLVFENMSNAQAEARTQIKLPPGAVVSDLTLWINGVPQPAAFAGKSKVRRAYQTVVTQRRDPVLVTNVGGDRVMLQCFPVPVKGTMKTRVRIASPMLIEKETSTLVLPKLVENNFDVFSYMKTSISSTTPFVSNPPSLIVDKSQIEKFSAKGVIDQNKLKSTVEPIVFRRNPDAQSVSKLFTVGSTSNVLTQKIELVHQPPSKNVVVVIDGSTSMRPHAKEISEALSAISDSLPWSVVLAADEVSALTPKDELYRKLTPKLVAANLATLRFEGGPDNASALLAALNIAGYSPDTKILWLHGPQPLLFEDVRKFEQLKNSPKVYSFEVESGPNIVEEKLAPYITFQDIPRFGTVEDDLKKTIRHLNDGADLYTAVRTVTKSNSAGRDPLHDELIKLWAADKVHSDLKMGYEDNAVKTASTYRVVTPVSGAVVLETARDYAINNLEQGVDSEKSKGSKGEPVFQEEADVPSVPEPEIWLMLFVVGALLILQQKGQTVLAFVRTKMHTGK